MIQAQDTRGEPTTNEDRASEGRHTITLRLSRPLIVRLWQAAALNRRSMTTEIAFAIEQGACNARDGRSGGDALELRPRTGRIRDLASESGSVRTGARGRASPRRCRGKSPLRVTAADRDAGSVLLEIPLGDWERWARRQSRRMLGSVHLRDDSAGTLGLWTRCGLDVDTDHDYEPALVWRQLTVWAGSELSQREDVASWDEDAEAALSALYRRLCSTCAAPEIATFAPQRGDTPGSDTSSDTCPATRGSAS